MNKDTATYTVRLSGVLWERAVDSLWSDRYLDIEGRRLGRTDGAWTWTSVGTGSRASATLDRANALEVLRYLESLAGMAAFGMDPEGARDTRAESSAAGRAVTYLRDQLR